MILTNNFSAGFYFRLLREYPGIITFLQPDFTVQFQSASFYTFSDRHPEETVGENFLQLLHPLDVQPFLTLLIAVKANAKAKPRLEVRLRKADGTYFKVETTITCVTSYNLVEGYVLYSQHTGGIREGNPSNDAEAVRAEAHQQHPADGILKQVGANHHAFAFSGEQTDLKHASGPKPGANTPELHLYKNLLDKTVLVAITDVTGRIVQANELFCRRTGHSQEELLTKNIGNILKVNPHSASSLSLHWDTLLRGGEWRGELCSQAKDGQTFWIEAVIQPLFNAGEVVNCLFFGYEITERKVVEDKIRQSESRLREAQAVAKVGHWEYDFRNRQTTWSDEVFNIYGINSADGPPSLQDLEKYHHPEDWPDMVEASRRAREQREIQNVDVRIVRSDNTIRYVNIIGKPLLSVAGKVVKLHGTIMDIDGRKLAEKKLQLHNEELQRINRQLDRFVYSATHDLRAPLMSMKGLVNLAQIDDEPAQQDKYYQLMLRSIDKLDNIIRDIVDISRNRRTDVQSDKINFDSLIREIQEGLSHLPGAEKIAVRVNVKQDGAFYSDAKRLGILFNNLLSNAYRYSDEDKAQSFVEVDAEVSDQEAVIRVADNGIGIGQEHQHRIFEMFYRATETRDGTGLGLYLVKEIVDILGGTIQIQSQLKAGTLFTVTLPNRKL